jgi:uncharacterized protein (DUF3084 family)
LEELLKQFMEQINQRFDRLETRLDGVEKEIGSLRSEQKQMRAELDEVRVEQKQMRAEQDEMRKEVAFYYGSLMREHENTRIEMRSNFKYLETNMNQHRGAIELLGEKIKTEESKEN